MSSKIELDIDDIVELYINQNLSLKVTADKLGVSRGVVSRILKEHNIVKDHSMMIAQRDSTLIEKYGCNPFLSEGAKQKARQTCLERYGSEFATNSPIVRQKMKATIREKYGGDSPYCSATVRDKSRTTMLDRYGVEYTLCSDELKSKVQQTNLEKYGYNTPLLNNDVKAKRNETMLNRYGYEYTFQNPEIQCKAVGLFTLPEAREKAMQTTLERYNVPWFCMTKECKSGLGGYSQNSTPNLNFQQLLNNADIIYEQEFGIENRTYDFKVNNTLIEINPTATHNSDWSPFQTPKDKMYHYNKSQLANKYGYRCIHIWDWDDPIKITNLLSISDNSPRYARKCKVKIVSEPNAVDFINNYHLQGYAKSTVNIGLYYNNVLISIMTFGKPRYNKKYEWELIRYCYSCPIVGGAEKLFTYFIRNYNPTSIISYCDYSKFTGEVYPKLGFTKSKRKVNPSVHWYNSNTEEHITDNLLRQRGFDQLFHTNYGKGASNEELMLQHGFVRIYDCGQGTYTWQDKRDD